MTEVFPRWNRQKKQFEPDGGVEDVRARGAFAWGGWGRQGAAEVGVRADGARDEEDRQLQGNWHDRDAQNSAPAVFTTVSDQPEPERERQAVVQEHGQPGRAADEDPGH